MCLTFWHLTSFNLNHLSPSQGYFFTEDGSYQWLKNATSFGLISDKIAEIWGSKYSNFGHFSIGWVPYYGIMVRTCTSISLLSVGIGLRFFYWRRVLSVAKGCHLVWLVIWWVLSNFTCKIQKSANSPYKIGHFQPLWACLKPRVMSHACTKAVFMLARWPVWRTCSNILEYLDLNYSALLAD